MIAGVPALPSVIHGSYTKLTVMQNQEIPVPVHTCVMWE
jgi:hypothetical protein